MYTLVTAGLSGIGYEIARELENQGSKVIVTTSRLDQVNHESNCFYMDLNNLESIKSLITEFKNRSIQIKSIFHCAHSFSESKLFLNIKANELEKSLTTNVVGTFELLKLFLKQMIRANEGNILVLGSSLAKNPAPGKLIYITEKNAIESLILSLNSEIKDKNIALKIFHPSLTSTKQVMNKINQEVIDKVGEDNILSPITVAKKAIEILGDIKNKEIIHIYNGNQKW